MMMPQILLSLKSVRPAVFVSQQGADILQSACTLISSSLSSATTQGEEITKIIATVTEQASKRREAEVHEALAGVYRRLSSLRNPSEDIER